MDWFEQITGFAEGGYAATRERLYVDGEALVSRVDGRRHGIGRLELLSLQTLRGRTVGAAMAGERTTVRCLAGDARALHAAPEFAGALFQVASQFNLLEMVSPEVTPEAGVTRYQQDHTQGPACAMAAGAATIYRNYFAPVGLGSGQTADHQIDALGPLGEALAAQLSRPVSSLWQMRNGYALGTAEGLAAVAHHLRSASAADLDTLRGLLAVGLHWQVEVTDVHDAPRPRVSQAFCSALPVAYSPVPAEGWAPLARLVLEAAYEATLRAACWLRQNGGSATVLLTRLGGGVFGNRDAWIDEAIGRALRCVARAGLDVRLVSFGSVHPAMRAIEAAWARGTTHADGAPGA